jgi:uncharacterized protein (DUF362 family)
MFDRRLTRAQFLKLMVSALAVLPLAGRIFGEAPDAVGAAAGPEEGAKFNGRPKGAAKGDYDLVIAKGGDPYGMTVKAVEAMGGMGRFVKDGATVVVKPNIGCDRSPAQAGNTDPQVVAALVEMAYKAGAKRVNVFDVTCNDPRRCYAASGIEKAAAAAGAKVYFPDDWDVIKAQFGRPSPMSGWPVLRDAVECDTFINCPVLKHHALTRLTLSIKNLMGVCAGNRGLMHFNIGPKLVDLARFINPDLTVIDACRVLTRNGPSGGSLSDVTEMKTVIAATDPTLADSFAAQLAGVDPADVPYIRSAVREKYGSADLAAARTVTIDA